MPLRDTKSKVEALHSGALSIRLDVAPRSGRRGLGSNDGDSQHPRFRL
jgi:hypothetical protein